MFISGVGYPSKSVKKNFVIEHVVGPCVNSAFQVYYFALLARMPILFLTLEVFFSIQDLFLYRTRDLHGINICKQHAFENTLQSPEILG